MSEWVQHEWVECSACYGSGRDEIAWDGRCPFCEHGERLVTWDPDDGIDEPCSDPERCS